MYKNLLVVLVITYSVLKRINFYLSKTWWYLVGIVGAWNDFSMCGAHGGFHSFYSGNSNEVEISV